MGVATGGGAQERSLSVTLTALRWSLVKRGFHPGWKSPWELIPYSGWFSIILDFFADVQGVWRILRGELNASLGELFEL